MSSADFPVDSPENRNEEIRLNSPDIDAEAESILILAEFLTELRNCNVDNLAEKRRQLAAEREMWQKEYNYKAAKRYAFNLHSDQCPKIIPRRENKEGDGTNRYQIALEAIKNRRSSISDTVFELNHMTRRETPTLMDLSLKVLANNSEAIKSLKLVPDHLRKKLSNLVSDLGKVDACFMQLLMNDSPQEVSVWNCIDLEEKDLIKILCDCDRASLTVLNLDLCGRAMTEHAITGVLKRSPNGFPSLTTLSLQGAFCLTDNAVSLISRSAPLLRFINLSHCSLLTHRVVRILAKRFNSTLRGLNIGGCLGIKLTNDIKCSLEKFTGLNYLSVAGLESINNVIIEFLTFRGWSLTDLSLAFCNDVTNGSIWTIGSFCPNLETLDISGLDQLTDTSLESITVGCRFLNSVNLTKTRFSDEAIAAFLEVSGVSLKQLCLNNCRDVGQNTAISLAKFCKELRYLDLSWCRKLTEEELGRILGCCSSLRSLKLFGWTQVKDEFLEELSRSHVHITGLKMASLFAHLDDSFPSVDAKFF